MIGKIIERAAVLQNARLQAMLEKEREEEREEEHTKAVWLEKAIGALRELDGDLAVLPWRAEKNREDWELVLDDGEKGVICLRGLPPNVITIVAFHDGDEVYTNLISNLVFDDRDKVYRSYSSSSQLEDILIAFWEAHESVKQRRKFLNSRPPQPTNIYDLLDEARDLAAVNLASAAADVDALLDRMAANFGEDIPRLPWQIKVWDPYDMNDTTFDLPFGVGQIRMMVTPENWRMTVTFRGEMVRYYHLADREDLLNALVDAKGLLDTLSDRREAMDTLDALRKLAGRER